MRICEVACVGHRSIPFSWADLWMFVFSCVRSHEGLFKLQHEMVCMYVCKYVCMYVINVCMYVCNVMYVCMYGNCNCHCNCNW